MTIKVAQIGCGYWGPNLLRNFSSIPDCHVKWVAETSEKRRIYVEENYPKSKTTAEWEDVLSDPEIDAVVIATPANTHYEFAKAALSAGKHTLVEKPLATEISHAKELATLAEARKLTLMTGHTFIYNNAVRYVKGLLDTKDLGEIYYFYTQRLNLGKVRSDVNAWWNLAPHDISILLYLMNNELPVSVAAHGTAYLQDGIEDVVFAVLTWKNKVTAHVHVSWLDPVRTRKITLVSTKKMVVYDDTLDNKIAIFDKGFDRIPKLGEGMEYDHFNKFQLLQRTGDIRMPKINSTEPLKAEAMHFLECVRGGAEPMTGPRHALSVVTVLEAAQRALKTEKTVRLDLS